MRIIHVPPLQSASAVTYKFYPGPHRWSVADHAMEGDAGEDKPAREHFDGLTARLLGADAARGCALTEDSIGDATEAAMEKVFRRLLATCNSSLRRQRARPGGDGLLDTGGQGWCMLGL